MAIVQRGVTYMASATGAIPTAQAGDLLVAFALRDGATGIPSEPTGWTTVTTGSGGVTASRIAYRYWQSGTAAPVFTNASAVVIASYSGTGPTPIGAFANQNLGSGDTTVVVPALTIAQADGNSMIAAAYLHRASNSLTTPAGMTEYVDSLEGIMGRVGYSLTTVPTASFASRTATATASGGWRSMSVEIVANAGAMMAYI